MYMLSSKKGAAILQVLLAAAILAGISVFLLRASLSRTSSSRQTRRPVAAQLEIESCMAEVNQLWAIKSPELFTQDMNSCIFYCNSSQSGETRDCSAENQIREFTCPEILDSEGTRLRHEIVATMSGENGNCQVTYAIQDAADL